MILLRVWLKQLPGIRKTGAGGRKKYKTVYGGSCFPEDTRAIVRIAEENGADLKVILPGLIERGAKIRAYDPEAIKEVTLRLSNYEQDIIYCDGEYEVMKGAKIFHAKMESV